MKNTLLKEAIKKAFGPAVEISEKPVRSLVQLRMDLVSFSGCLERWATVARGERPVLKGLATSPVENSRIFLNVLLELGREYPVICVEIEFPRDKVLPDLATVWPYSSWWQEELEAFNGLRFGERSVPEGISWQLA